MEDKDLFGNSKIKTRNIVISGTNLWNPGDDFVRDGIIKVLKELFKGEQLNFLFYNFNQDFFPQSKFDGISNMAAAGDLDKYRDFIDAIIIPGLSAGNEIKDLYNWIIANGLQNKVYILGAGYENDYVEKHISEEPEATIFKSAGVITGRTAKRPAFIDNLGLTYKHINCPAILSVDKVKNVPQGKKIERIGFSIQLPKNLGISNQRTGNEMYKLAVQILAELSQKYTVEIVAHHKTEYFHFLNLLKDHNIPVIFSSFYHDLHNIYPRYDLVISTRLHACLFANGFGIPAFIINETDRHTHSSAGFPHSICINNMESFQHSFNGLLMQELSSIARGAEVFKVYLMEKYVEALAGPFGVSVMYKERQSIESVSVDGGNFDKKKENNVSEVENFFSDLQRYAQSVENQKELLSVFQKLEYDKWTTGKNIPMFQKNISENKTYLDMATVIRCLAKAMQPKRYLEIGVRKGRSLALVFSASPNSEIWGFDIWRGEYAGETNPGKEYVIREMMKFGDVSKINLIKGDSKKTIPEFFNDPANPQKFDLILVDGDHHFEGALTDLRNVINHLSPGGILVFDDFLNEACPRLMEVWNIIKNEYPNLIFKEFYSGSGVGVAIKAVPLPVENRTPQEVVCS